MMSEQFPEVEFDDCGFRLIQQQKVLREVRWADIQEIVAFKRDLFSYDAICLGFRIDERDHFVEVAEDYPGYKPFLSTVEQRFPLKDDWWREVAFPAFATNWTTIWKHSVESEV